MPFSWRAEEPCPRCAEDSDVWVFEKEEPTITKEHYACDVCGWEWTEVRKD